MIKKEQIETLDRIIEHHRSKMLAYSYMVVCIEEDPQKIEKLRRRAKGHETQFRRFIEKKRRLESGFKTKKSASQ